MPKKPMTVNDAYNKTKGKPKPSKEAYDSFNKAKPKVSSTEYKRNQVTKSGMGSGSRTKTTSGMGSGNRTSSASVGASREKVTRTGQGLGNTGPKKKGKSFLDRVGDVGKGVGRFGFAIAKDTAKMVNDPTGYAINTAKQIGKDVKNRNIAGLGLAAASMIPIPGAKGTAAAIKAAGKAGKAVAVAGKAGKATKSLSQLADDAVKAGAKGAKSGNAGKTGKEMYDIAVKSSKSLKPVPKPTPAQIAQTKEVKEKLAKNPIRKPKPATPAPKPASPKPTPKPSSKPPSTPKPKTKIESAQAELDDVRKKLADLKATKGGKYKDDIEYKRLTEQITAKQQKVANAVKEAATPPRDPRGVTQKTMTDGPVKAGDAQRTYSGVGRTNTPRNGMTGTPKPNKGQYEGDMLRGQTRNDAASMSNRGLRGSSRATREGRVTENKARNVENIKIRENDRKVAKYNDMLAKAKASKKPKDIAAAKNYADFWKLKGIKKLK